MKEIRLIKTYNLFEDIIDMQVFVRIEISPDGKYADALSNLEMLRFEVDTRKSLKSFLFGDKEFNDVRDRYRSKKDSIKNLDNDFLIEVISQLNIFSGCDFSEATFLDKYGKEMLEKMGAICDFTEDKFIEGRKKECIRNGIEISEMLRGLLLIFIIYAHRYCIKKPSQS